MLHTPEADNHKAGPRHWHTVWVWAGQHSKAMLFFLSAAYEASENCQRELEEFATRRAMAQEAGEVVPEAFFVLLDGTAKGMVPAVCEEIGIPMRNDRLFDLAATEMLLYEGREAGVSNEAMWRCRANAARSLWRLRGQLGELAGRGDEAVVEEDVRRLWESNAKDDLGLCST